MALAPETPRSLRPPLRRRASDTPRTWKMKVTVAAIGLLTTIVGGYYSGLSAVGDRDRSQLERIATLEARQEDQYKAILARLDEIKQQQEQYRQDARADINHVRGEILQMLRNR